MKRIGRKLMVLAMAAAVVAGLFACGGSSPITTDDGMALIAQNVGYFGYTLVPGSRLYLEAICAITGDDPVAMNKQLTELIGKVWQSSNTQVGYAVALQINVLVTILKNKVNAATDKEGALKAIKSVTDNLCAGITAAQKAGV